MIRRLLRWCFYALGLGLLLAGAAVLYYGSDLPAIDGIHEVKRRPQVTILDAAGARLAVYGDLYAEPVTLHDLPPHVARAVTSIEDRRYFGHFGVDLYGLARAVAVNIASGRIRQGGSTITQQLAKVAFLTPERSMGRKVREALLAMKIESKYSKDEILALYLNRVYFGSGAYGIEAASRRYFGRSAKQLTLYQAAMLAGLLRAPSRDNPHVSRERAERRTAVVLDTMVETGAITAAQARAARAGKTAVTPPPGQGSAQYFADWIIEELPNYVSVGQDDLVVRTTLSAEQQGLAERHLASALAREAAAYGARQAAMVVLAPDGAVRALVGGADYKASQFNRATQALRQPGSTFKLFVLLAALQYGYKPSDRFLDAPIAIGGWRPRNFQDQYYGEVSIGDAMALSLNSVTVRLAERVGRWRIIDVAELLGIKSPLKADPSLALGTGEVTLLELTGAYAVLANRGRAAEPYGILEIRGRRNAPIYQRRSRAPARLLPERTVREAHAVLRAVTTRGTARRANLLQPSYGKTGTTQDSRDAWFVGYTSELVAGVWFGNDDRATMKDLTGGAVPARVWGAFMRDALAGRDLKTLEAEGEDEDRLRERERERDRERDRDREKDRERSADRRSERERLPPR